MEEKGNIESLVLRLSSSLLIHNTNPISQFHLQNILLAYCSHCSPLTMDFYRKLLSIFRKQQKPDAFTSPLLKKVPIEILLIIMDHLPLESAVAFSLSCMYLKRNLGTQHLSRLASSTEDTLALLNLLALDLPNCVVCSACKRLHEMENLRSYNSLTYSAGCTTPR